MLILPKILPHPALQSIVHHYMLLHLQFNGATPVLKPMPAEPYQSLYFYPRDPLKKIIHSTGKAEKMPSSNLVGAQTSRINIEFGQDHLVIQVAFCPGGLYRLFGIPMAQFFDISVDAEDIYNKEMQEVNEKLAEAIDYKQMIQSIEEFLLRKLKNIRHEKKPIDRAMQMMLISPNYSLDKLANEACLSIRQFERNFYERLGMNPKIFARVVRFNQILNYKRTKPQADLLEAIYACGYFDFSHLKRDFMLFAGESPTTLFSSDQNSLKDMQENVVFLHS